MTRLIERLRNAGWKTPTGIAAAVLLGSMSWWGPPLLSHLAYFRVRRVEIYGRTFVQPSQILARLHVDTTMSIWMDLTPLERRVARDPQVRSVEIERKLPGTLVVRLLENLPVALVAGAAGGMKVVDGAGHVLPIDPTRSTVDLPVVDRVDTALLRLLADVRAHDARLFEQISWAQRGSGAGPGSRADGDVTLEIPPVLVRAAAGVTAQRLADIVPVEADLARRHARVAELDLRFRDQVIARLQ
ncbi:MAG TPA: FtsQ-type POTRA domain-containing protein [Gemmatimonadaceae bacterium]|jgi:cell division protein FtsQ